MEILTPVRGEVNLVSMRSMVDLALGTPEVGFVNFNILHSLLHAILSKFGMGDLPVDMSNDQSNIQDPQVKIVPVTTPPFHALQERMKILENQISDLNSLPSNADIMSNILGSNKKAEAEGQKLVSDLWQTINMRKKVNANEEGIDRLSSMVDSILDEMKRLKSDNETMRKQLEDLSGLKGVGNKVDGLQNELADLLAEFNKLKDILSEYPPPETLRNIVTWEALEKALKGIKDDMDELRKPTERIVVNMSTEPMSRPVSQSSNNGPSEACAEMLEKLGVLTIAHDLLDKRVVVLEEEMPNKADKKDLENLKIPDDLLKTISQLKAQMDSLMSAKNRVVPAMVKEDTDTEALSRIRDILNSLQDKMNAVNDSLQKLAMENKDLLTQIEELFGITKDHENRKADIGYVDGVMRMKADKSLLDTKVNFSLFDETTGNLHNLIDDVLKKLLAAEDELRNLLKSLALELNGKVDKDDLNALKEWIEKRLRALAEKLKNFRGGDVTDDDAAGLRKQLLQHFHCISCDRPVDIMSHGVNYGTGIPEPKGLPPSKSMRPYTTFELDAIRQHSKNNKNMYVQNHTKRYGADIIDVYQTPRPCGGSHTTNNSQKKAVRLGNLNNSYIEEDNHVKVLKEELDLQGADGHIYKGRFDRSQTMINNNNYVEQPTTDKLPPVTATPRSQTTVNNNYTPRGAFITSRPKSAVKITPRHSAGSSHSRPSSARVTLPEPDSRPTSPIQIIEQIVEENLANSEDFLPISDQNQTQITNNETIITSDSVNIEVINQSENEIQSSGVIIDSETPRSE